MKFYMPTLVYEETNCVEAHADELCGFGKKALLVTGAHSADQNGALSDVKEVLEAHGLSWAHFNQIEENPSVETIMKAREFGNANACDFVIGIGGGSPMDAAKAIALMMQHPDQDWIYMYDKNAATDPLPLVLIPTTCGTGSEVTPISVLTRHDLRTKGSIPHRIFAQLSLLDAKYLTFAPQSVLCSTSMDAFAHLAESYINRDANDYSRMCVAAGLKAWEKTKDVMLGNRTPEIDDYRNMLNASMFAGMAIAHTGTSIPHGLSYALTYDIGMAHGSACGYFLKGYMQEVVQQADAVMQMAGFADLSEFEVYYKATCKPQHVPQEIIKRSVTDLLAAPQKLAKAPYEVNETVLSRIAGL